MAPALPCCQCDFAVPPVEVGGEHPHRGGPITLQRPSTQLRARLLGARAGSVAERPQDNARGSPDGHVAPGRGLMGSGSERRSRSISPIVTALRQICIERGPCREQGN
jgi:hypothetical protein